MREKEREKEIVNERKRERERDIERKGQRKRNKEVEKENKYIYFMIWLSLSLKSKYYGTILWLIRQRTKYINTFTKSVPQNQ